MKKTAITAKMVGDTAQRAAARGVSPERIAKFQQNVAQRAQRLAGRAEKEVEHLVQRAHVDRENVSKELQGARQNQTRYQQIKNVANRPITPAAPAAAAPAAAAPAAAAPAAAAPAAAAPAAAAPAAAAPAAAAPAAAAPAAAPTPGGEPTFLQRYGRGMALGGGLTALGVAGIHGLRDAREQDARMQDYMGNMRHDLTAPMPSLKVGMSYEKLAQAKLAGRPGPPLPPPTFGERLTDAGAAAGVKSFTDSLARKLVEDPIDAAYGILRKKLKDEPEWNENFTHVVSNDPMLSQAHSENPNMLPDAFASIKRFSPSLAKDRLATRNLLKHVVMSGGELDHSVMKMLAETEKLRAESKRR